MTPPPVPVPAGHLAADLPPPAEPSRGSMRGGLLRTERRLVVLDDDPTGTQTVRDAPVLTTWSVPALDWALRQAAPLVFVLTNSRALAEPRAVAVAAEATRNALAAAARLGIEITVVSRADSTLRGHYPAETDAIASVLGEHGTRVDAVLLAPAFIEAGRLTRDGVHYALAHGQAVPVADTEFARDATFGYVDSELRAWAARRSNGRWSRDRIELITVGELRSCSTHDLARRFPTDGRPIVADALVGEDLDVLARAVQLAQAAGRYVLVRCGPSFVRALAGASPSQPLHPDELAAAMDPTSRPYGLVVAGSHTAVTTRQLLRLDELGPHPTSIEIDARLAGHAPAAEIDRVLPQVLSALADGDVVLRTSRERVDGGDRDESLAVAGRIAEALRTVVQRVVAAGAPRWILAKGGITSADVAGLALPDGRGWVLGQMRAGLVPVWVPARGPDRGPASLCVIFPGNVGDDNTLAHVVAQLRAAASDVRARPGPGTVPMDTWR